MNGCFYFSESLWYWEKKKVRSLWLYGEHQQVSFSEFSDLDFLTYYDEALIFWKFWSWTLSLINVSSLSCILFPVKFLVLWISLSRAQCSHQWRYWTEWYVILSKGKLYVVTWNEVYPIIKLWWLIIQLRILLITGIVCGTRCAEQND